MPYNQPVMIGAPPRSRPFAAFPAAIQAVIINEYEELLLLASPTREPVRAWQVISGGLEAGETILDGALREVREEAGQGVRVRPLGIVHARTFQYDAYIPFMLSIYYLMAYEGGEIVPGDDMTGSAWRWWRVDELFASANRCTLRPTMPGCCAALSNCTICGIITATVKLNSKLI